MTNAQIPAKQLWLATLTAIAAGLVTLVTVIMPAEYNIDPTGIGVVLGNGAVTEQLIEAPSALEWTQRI